jgi:hypothetical protein
MKAGDEEGSGTWTTRTSCEYDRANANLVLIFLQHDNQRDQIEGASYFFAVR